MGDEKGTKPEIPKGTPKDIVDFVDCTSPNLTIATGKAPWIKNLIKELVRKQAADAGGKEAGDAAAKLFDTLAGDPTVTVEPGAKAGAAKVTIDAGAVDLTLEVAVKNGKLEVDAKNLPIDAAKDGVTKWVDDLNKWLEANKKKLGGITVKDGKASVAKDTLAASTVPQPTDGEYAAAGPRAGTGTLVAAGTTVVAGVALGFGLMGFGDSTATETKTVQVAAQQPADKPTGPAKKTDQGQQPAQPAVEKVPQPNRIVDGAFCVVHGQGSSDIFGEMVVPQGHDGTYTATFAKGPTGAVSGSGPVSGGQGKIPIRITRFGTYDDFSVTGPDGTSIDTGKLKGPFTVTSAPVACPDFSALTAPPALEERVTNPAPAPEIAGDESPKPAERATASPPLPQEVTITTTTTTEVPPWSLLMIPGGIVAGGGIYLFGRRRDPSQPDLAIPVTPTIVGDEEPYDFNPF